MEDFALIIKKYIILNIYSEIWLAGQKIPSSKQLAIKFNISINTIKKVLNIFLKCNILVSEKRIGYMVNPKIYELLPLSLRKKYDIEPSSFYIDKKDKKVKIRKEYTNDKEQVLVFVESEVFHNNFIFSEYQKEKTFMWNLAFNGICVFKFDSFFSFVDIDGKKYSLEERNLYNEENIIVAKEKIYVPSHMWKEHKKIDIY